MNCETHMKSIIKKIIWKLCDFFPRQKYVVYSGIKTGLRRNRLDELFKRLAPEKQDQPSYEITLLSGLSQCVSQGDRVVIVGGGYGVTAVKAANHSGDNGLVTVYEGSETQSAIIRQTLQLNGVKNVEIVSSIVGANVAVYDGFLEDVDITDPTSLPDCDVLELDCEGAEVFILDKMTIRPYRILVETHGIYGAPTKLITEKLMKKGYSVVNLGIAEPQYQTFCEKNDIFILQATLLNA